MSKKCPNCGFSEADDAKFCHICGGPLVDDVDFSEPISNSFGSASTSGSNDDFDFDFGANTAQSSSIGFGATYSGANTMQPPMGNVPITISDGKANKLKKNVYSWCSSLFALCIMRFVFIFIGLSDVEEMASYLPFFEGEEIYGPLNSFVNIYFAEIAVLVLFLVSAIVLLVCATHLNRFHFPVQNTDVFKQSKKAFFASIATTVVVVVYFILEVSFLLIDMRLNVLLNEPILSSAQNVGALVVDVLLVVGAIICMVSSLKLSRCKRD